MTSELPGFPNFRPFTFSDINWYYDFYISNNLNPYSDIHPGNLLAWLNIRNDLAVCKLNDAVVLKYTNVLNDNLINIIPLASRLNDSVIENIMGYLRENNLQTQLSEIPSTTCSDLNNNQWSIENDRNNYEYILDTDQQSSLLGNSFKTHRRCVNTFERDHANDCVEIKYFDEFDDEINALFFRHINSMPFNYNEKNSQHNTAEPIAIRKNLDYALSLHKKALSIKINGKIAALAMITYLDKNTASINHLKVDYSVRYIFKYTNYQLARILKEKNIREMNIEQDLGIEGMRQFKTLLQPSRFLDKKTIRPHP
jgi:hypothetical protein